MILPTSDGGPDKSNLALIYGCMAIHIVCPALLLVKLSAALTTNGLIAVALGLVMLVSAFQLWSLNKARIRIKNTRAANTPSAPNS